MSIKLDLKQFKHKESGDESTTLEHQDGHLLTLSHGKLSKEHKAMLEALQKSSKVDSKSSSKPKNKEPIKMASGGQVPYKLDEPEDITKGSLIPTESDLGAAAVQQENPQDFLPSKVLKPEPKAIEPEAPAQPEQPKPADFVLNKAGHEGLAEYARLGPLQRDEYLQKIGYGAPNEMPVSQPSQATSPSQAQPTPEAMVQPEATSQAMPQGVQESVQRPQPVTPAPVQVKEPLPSDDYLKQVQDVQHDFANGYITPKTYSSMFSNESTLGKIGTIFGLLVSGVGSGLSKQPNMLMDMMDKEIQRDLEAQKASKSNQMNFMQLAEQHIMNEANITHLKNEDKLKARALAQQYAYMSAYDRLARQAQAMPEGPAKVNALNALAGIAQSIQDKALMTGSMLDAQYEVMKRSPQLGKPTPGQEEVDREFAKEYAKFTTSGATNAKNSMNKIELLVREMKKDQGFGEAGGGRAASVLPDVVRARDAIRRRDAARNLANATLKELFGSQLSDAEREAAAKEYYNDALSNKENVKILEGKLKELKSVYDNKLKQAKYFEQNKGTLRGFKGSEAQGANFESNSADAARAWLKANPNHPKAAAVRKQLGE